MDYQQDTVNIFFPNQKEPRPEDREEFLEYWRKEKNRCINGFYLADGQVYISGILYFYCVYWTIKLDKTFVNPITKKKSTRKALGTPLFRDIEWEVLNEDIERALKEHSIYFLNACRGIGKSYLTAGVLGHAFTFVDDSENIVSSGSDKVNSQVTSKIDDGLSNIHPIFRKQRINNDWKKAVVAGWKDKKTGLRKGSGSRILMYNYQDGNNSMATNGTRPFRQLIDETGMIQYLIPCVLDSMPSWMTDDGFSALVMMTGTGGEQNKGEHAGKIFNNPEIYNVLSFDDVWEGSGKIAKFIPVTKGRNEFKEPWTLYDYLKKKIPQYKDLKPHPDLLNITILVSNEERCMEEFVIPRRNKLKKSISSTEIIREKAYYPIKPSECFLKTSSNDFPTEILARQKASIETSGFKPVRVKLFRDESNIVRWKDTEDVPVEDFPVTPNSNKKGVIEIIEFPAENSEWGTYVAGIDPIKISQSDTSTSVASIYIWKRMTTDMTEPFQNMPVAWYNGRPDNIREWHENALMLIEFYNATAMSESNDESFIQYVIGKNKQYLLAKGQSALRELNPNTKYKGEYGLPANIKTIEHWTNSLILYTKTDFGKQVKEDGTEEVILGANKILDPMLITEILAYDKNNKKFNGDRLRAASIACAYANQLDASLGKAKFEESFNTSTYVKPINSPFMIHSKKSSFKVTGPTVQSLFNIKK